MRGFRRISAMIVAGLLAGCGGGGDSGGLAGDATPTSSASVATGACGLRPIDFTAERWRASGSAASGVLWEQEYNFSNPNTVDVRLSMFVLSLNLSGPDGHFFKGGRTTFRPVADEVVPAGRGQQRFAQAWLASGNTPTTDDLFAKATAVVGGSECPVTIERLSGRPAPDHVLARVTCDPEQAATPC